ncbi:hypothetical protein WCN91_02515 [Pseudoalteromonas sp. YIC-827]|uniref:Uncharacterized protein n=1 Tax=Pseudoalteromonas qingdaonensis TaxID=3131913 RepID=A0ABU9MSR8_9GAMM
MKFKLTSILMTTTLLALGSTHVQADDQSLKALQAIEEFKVPFIRMINAYKEGGGSTTFLYEKHSAQSELKVTPYRELVESASN